MANISIFISSVQREFAQERKLLAEYISTDALLGRFFSPFIFEDMPAHTDTVQKVYLKGVENCTIYLGLFGQDYGYEDEEGVSPTEREFDYATKLYKDRLIFIKGVKERHPKEVALIHKAEQCVVRRSFDSYEELKAVVYAALVRYLEDHEYLRLLPFDATLHRQATLADIDDERIREFVPIAQRKHGFPIPVEAGTQRILTHLNLTSDGRVTNAALLLFGKDPQKFFPTSEVKCVQFYTNVVSKPLAAYQIYRGTVFDMVESAVAFVMSRIDAKVGARDTQTSVDVDFELPMKAVRECIINAIVHRDYTSNGSVQVMLFSDRLEVWNPGQLPLGLTVADLYMPHASLPPNPLIAHSVYLTGNIETVGTGTSDMIEECEKMGLPQPQFIQEANFRSILWRKTVQTSPETVHTSPETVHTSPETVHSSSENAPTSPQKCTKLNKKQKLVLDFCKGQAHSSQEILDYIAVKKSTRTVNLYMTELVLAGLLVPTTEKANDPKRKYITKEA